MGSIHVTIYSSTMDPMGNETLRNTCGFDHQKGRFTSTGDQGSSIDVYRIRLGNLVRPMVKWR